MLLLCGFAAREGEGERRATVRGFECRRGPGFVSGDGEGSGCECAAGGCSEVSRDPVLRVVGLFDGSGGV